MSRRIWSSEFLPRAVRSTVALAAVLAVAAALAAPIATHGQPPPLGPGKRWQAQGPGPAYGGQSENAAPGDAISGAIHTVLAHPTDSKVLYVGSVNGGVWKTTNAHQASPHWQSLTDGMPTSAIGALEYDFSDASHSTIWAGVGRFSSFGRLGGNRVGLYRSSDAGTTWTHVTGGGILNGKNISGIAARGDTIVISVDTADAFTFGNISIWRSTNGGATFTQVGVGNGAASGLPGGVTYDLVGDRTNPSRLFTSVVFANLVGGLNGVYRSTDTGATWSKVSSPAMDALLISGVTSNVEFAVGPNDNVYAAIANSGRLAGLFRSGDGGTTWAAMDIPRTGPNNVGIHPGGQASIHLSIVADPTDPDIVYIGGDRQPYTLEEGLPFPPQFPNTIGAENFSGRLFRCDAALAAGSQCTPLTHSGTANNSSPHADSREMVFDAAGNIIETDDGGVYKRSNPRSAAGRWTTLNGNIQVSEQHDASFDTLADVVFVGTQDNDDPHQSSRNRADWFVLLSGDGGDTAVDNVTMGPDVSIRYDSAQGLQAFLRSFWDNRNNLLGYVFPPLTVLGGGPGFSGQFTTPVEVNAIEPVRLAIGGANGTWESLDQGDTIRRISTVVPNGSGVDAIAYGGVGNPDLLVVGSTQFLYLRDGAHPDTLDQVASFPANGETVRDIVIDPDDGDAIYVTTLNRVLRSTDGGATWENLTGNILSFGPIALRAIAYAPRASEGDPSLTNDAVVVSTFNGIFISYESEGFSTWYALDRDLPKVPILDLHWDAENQAMIAGTLGRGAWKMSFRENEE